MLKKKKSQGRRGVQGFSSLLKECFSHIWGSCSFKHTGFISVGFSAGECDRVVSDRLPWANIWSFQLLPPRFTERRSEGLGLAGGNAKHTNHRVVFHGFFFFSPLPLFFFSPSSPTPYRWLSTVWPLQLSICSIPISKKWQACAVNS